MSDGLIGALAGVAGTVVVAVIGYFAKLRSDRVIEKEKHKYQLSITKLNLEAEYDKELRKLRIEVYKELWSALENYDMAKTKAGEITAEEFGEKLDILQNWYYKVGGMFLSLESQVAFLDFHAALLKAHKKILLVENQSLKAKDPVTKGMREIELLENIQKEFRELTYALTKDINTAKIINY